MERALALVLALVTGCSFVGLRTTPPDCTENQTLPTIDATGAAVLAAGGTIGIVANETKPSAEREGWPTNVGIAMIGLAIPLAISAWWGYHNTARCRESHRQQ